MCLRRHGSRDRTITEADAPLSRTERTEDWHELDVAILKVGDSVSIQVGQGLLIKADKP